MVPPVIPGCNRVEAGFVFGTPDSNRHPTLGHNIFYIFYIGIQILTFSWFRIQLGFQKNPDTALDIYRVLAGKKLLI